MPKSPPCSQYEPPDHTLVTRKTGTTFCRKKPVARARKAAPAPAVRKTRKNKAAPAPAARKANKDKFLVSMKFNFRNTRSNNNFNNLSANNKKTVLSAKPPTNKELANYMREQKRYENYLTNLYAYGEYGKTPNVQNFNGNRLSYVIDPAIKGFNKKALFPSAKSIKSSLNFAPRRFVYPVKISKGDPVALGIIGFKNVKISKI